jgi:hypothetical protein
MRLTFSECNGDALSFEEYKDLQVEHIFAKEPNFDAIAYGFTEDYDYERNRIGNLGLLEQSLNKGLSNLPPINKVSGYLNSQIKETRNLAGEIQKGKFSKINVDSRRKEIVTFCIDRFNLNIQTNVQPEFVAIEDDEQE